MFLFLRKAIPSQKILRANGLARFVASVFGVRLERRPAAFSYSSDLLLLVRMLLLRDFHFFFSSAAAALLVLRC